MQLNCTLRQTTILQGLTFFLLVICMIHGKLCENLSIPRWLECMWQTCPKQQDRKEELINHLTQL